jgi:hypothetical protein
MNLKKLETKAEKPVRAKATRVVRTKAERKSGLRSAPRIRGRESATQAMALKAKARKAEAEGGN